MPAPSVSDAGASLPAGLLTGLVFLAFLIGGCGAPSAPTSGETAEALGPILLITVTGLRADSVGPLTPVLESFQAQCRAHGWAGSGLAVSTETAPALASLLTGLRPWQTQVLHGGQIRLPASRTTLAEALADLGYRTVAFLPNYRLRFGHGYRQGFDDYLGLGEDGPTRFLAQMDGSPTFVWIHLPEPQPPYRQIPRWRSRLEAVEPLPRRLPKEMDWADLETARSVTLPETRRLHARALYHYEVAELDDTVGHLLEALRSSGQWQRSLVVFASLHGTQLGEYGRIGVGESLYREVLEVPLLIKLPASRSASSSCPACRPAVSGLWATLVHFAGGTPPPAVEPDVLSPAAARPVLSELYRGNGVNLFSLVDGDRQLLRSVPFAPPERAYRSARLVQLGIPRERLKPPVEARPLEPLSRLRRAFDQSLPFTSEEATLQLLRWSASGGGSQSVDDPETRDRMAQRLEQRWHAFVPIERTPAREVVRAGTIPPARDRR